MPVVVIPLFVIKNRSGQFFTKSGNGVSAIFGWAENLKARDVYIACESSAGSMLIYLQSLGVEEVSLEPYQPETSNN